VRLTLAAGLVLVGGAAWGGEMNISQFVFRDMNRNGIFDAGESPMPGVTIRLEQESVDPIFRSSNLAGFTNFAMSSDEDDKDITEPGAVSFNVEIPEGFDLTTGNPSQEGRIFPVDGAPAGLALDPPMPFMGIAPTRTIESRSDGVNRMSCAQGDTVIPAARWDDRLVCTVGPGVWDVSWQVSDGAPIERQVTVSDWPIRVPVRAESGEGPADTVLTFDGIIDSENIQEMAASEGFVWHNLIAVHRKFYGGWGYVNGTVSGEFSAYNSSGHPATLSSSEPFTFHGAFISVAWPEAKKARVRIEGYAGDQLVAEDAFFASNLRPIWFDANWDKVDRVVFSHDRYWQLVIDDLKLSRR